MKNPRKDDLPAFEETRVTDVIEQVGNAAGEPGWKPTGEKIDTGVTLAHHNRTKLRFNGPPAAFVEAMKRLDINADPMGLAEAVFAAHAEAALDAAAHGDAHRKLARHQVEAEIDALKSARAAINALREAQAGGYDSYRLAGLVGRRNGSAKPDRQLDVATTSEAIESDLAVMTAVSNALNGQGEARTTRLRMFAQRLAPIYIEAAGRPVKGRSSAYADKGALTGFPAFVSAACDLVAGSVPPRSLIENVAKELVKN